MLTDGAYPSLKAESRGYAARLLAFSRFDPRDSFQLPQFELNVPPDPQPHSRTRRGRVQVTEALRRVSLGLAANASLEPKPLLVFVYKTLQVGRFDAEKQSRSRIRFRNSWSAVVGVARVALGCWG